MNWRGKRVWDIPSQWVHPQILHCFQNRLLRLLCLQVPIPIGPLTNTPGCLYDNILPEPSALQERVQLPTLPPPQIRGNLESTAYSALYYEWYVLVREKCFPLHPCFLFLKSLNLSVQWGLHCGAVRQSPSLGLNHEVQCNIGQHGNWSFGVPPHPHCRVVASPRASLALCMYETMQTTTRIHLTGVLHRLIN